MQRIVPTEPRVIRAPDVELTGLHRQESEKNVTKIFCFKEDVWKVDSKIREIIISGATHIRHPNEPEGVPAGFVNAAALERGMISPDVNVATTSLIGFAKVGAGVILEWGSRIEDGVTVGDNVTMGHNVILCSGSVIGPGTAISSNLLVTPGTVIPAGVFIDKNGDLQYVKPIPSEE